MRYIALCIVSALAACAHTQPAAPHQVAPLSVAQASASPKVPNINDMDIVCSQPDGWVPSADADGNPEDAAAGSLRHVHDAKTGETDGQMLIYGDKLEPKYLKSPTDHLRTIMDNVLVIPGRIRVAEGSELDGSVWASWEGTSGDKAQVPIMGMISVWRLPAPFDDVLITLAGAWVKSLDNQMKLDFDKFRKTLKLVERGK